MARFRAVLAAALLATAATVCAFLGVLAAYGLELKAKDRRADVGVAAEWDTRRPFLFQLSGPAGGTTQSRPVSQAGDLAFVYEITGVATVGHLDVRGSRIRSRGRFVLLTVRARSDSAETGWPAGYSRRHWGHFALFDTTGGRYFADPAAQRGERPHGVAPGQTVTYRVLFDLPGAAVPAHATIRAAAGQESAWITVPRR